MLDSVSVSSIFFNVSFLPERLLVFLWLVGQLLDVDMSNNTLPPPDFRYVVKLMLCGRGGVR